MNKPIWTKGKLLQVILGGRLPAACFIVLAMDFKHSPHPPKSPFPIGEGGLVIAHIIYVHNHKDVNPAASSRIAWVMRSLLIIIRVSCSKSKIRSIFLA